MALKESQIKMYDHSEVKITLLKRYLEKYLNIIYLLSYIKSINIYDLFCGEGIYENGGKGSPIEILEIVKNIHFQNKNSNKPINCLFNDIDKKKVDKLQSEIKTRNLHYSSIGKLEFSYEDYKNILPKTVRTIKTLNDTKTFIFIDPYGYKEIRLSDIRDLLSTKTTEVLLFLPTQFMFRFEEKGTPEALIEFISEIVPKDKWPKSDTGIEFIENLNDGFQNKLGNEYFVDSFIITRNRNQFFCLFFFTSHIYGFDKMQETKWQIDEEEGRGWQFEENNLFSNTQKSPNTYIFEKKLQEFLAIFRTNGEIYEFTLHQRHRPSHANQVLIKLQNEQKITALKKDGTPARKSSFYLSYDNYKNESDKIKVKINSTNGSNIN